jgi:DNA polymerase-3 subunit gamma/tau
MVLYRKYRPQKLSDLIGQEHVVKTLLASLESGKIAHGYLFSGPRGTGKTSTARILAKAVNCEVYSGQLTVDGKGKKTVNRSLSTVNTFGEPCNKCAACKAITDGSYLDLIEIDAASNRGIDEIRDLREKIKLSPVAGKFKVYIIDEVHMLTTEAFNALLKTLEEPPAHALFILCTTEEGKLPETIISRLLRFNFKRAVNKDLQEAIAKICKAEKIDISKEAIEAVVKAGDGSYRDALSVLEQVSSGQSRIGEEDVKSVMKVSGRSLVFEFADLLVEKDLPKLAKNLEEISADLDLLVFNRELLLFFEKVMQIKLNVLPKDDSHEAEKYEAVAQKVDFGQLQNLLKILLVAEGDMKYYPLPQISLLLAFGKWCGEPKNLNNQYQIRELVSRKFEITNAKDQIQKITENRNEKIIEDKKELKVKVAEVALVVEESKVKKTKQGKVVLDDVLDNWAVFLSRIRPVNAHIVALLRSTRPVSMDGDTLNLEVFFRFHKDKLEEPKIMDLLCNTMSEILESKVVFKMQLAQRTSKPPVTVSRSNVAEPVSEDLSRLAEEIFLK